MMPSSSGASVTGEGAGKPEPMSTNERHKRGGFVTAFFSSMRPNTWARIGTDLCIGVSKEKDWPRAQTTWDSVAKLGPPLFNLFKGIARMGSMTSDHDTSKPRSLDAKENIPGISGND